LVVLLLFFLLFFTIDDERSSFKNNGGPLTIFFLCGVKNWLKIQRMSFEVRILDAHLDKIKQKTRAYSKEQGEHFYHDILDFKLCYHR